MTAPGSAPTPDTRLVGIDLARFAAIVGMMSAHLIVPLADDPSASDLDAAVGAFLAATVSSTAATTFAVLGGVSLVLLTRRITRTGRMLLTITIRGILISLIGTLLLPIDGPISVVLTYYGIAMIIAGPALLLPSWVVAGGAGLLWLFGAVVNLQVRGAGTPPPADLGAEIARAARDLLITGHYPAITWVAYMLTGILIARMLLAARDDGRLRTASMHLGMGGLLVYLLLTIGGRIAVAAMVGVPEQLLRSGYGAPLGTEPWMLWIPTPHSGNPADMLRTVAGACFVIGILVALVDGRARHPGIALESVRAAGAAPLTIYTTHVVVTGALHHAALAAADGEGTPWYRRGAAIFLLQLAGVLLIGVVLALLHRRGPLETFIGWVSGAASPGGHVARPVLPERRR